jgi:MFS family permease
MTQPESGAPEDTVSTQEPAPTLDSGALAPLRCRVYRFLWIGVVISWIGTWMQTVGAQWLLVDAPNAAALVSLVQAATTLPVMLLALPGGVLADTFDRRWLLFSIQAYFFVVGIVLAALTAFGHMPPALLITFTFLLGVGAAVQLPTWSSTVPELVPRSQLRAASRLDLVGVNVSRAIGPAIGGVIIAHFGGVPVVFALNALSVVVLAVALLRWRRASGAVRNRERFVRALRAGGRYVWHEPLMRRLLARVIIFVVPAVAMWALLPVIAAQHLKLGADGYGALFGALGGGAILGAVLLGRIKSGLSTNGILTAGASLYAAALAMLILVPNVIAAVIALVFNGIAWMSVTSTLQAEAQLVLPNWVRARGIAIYTMTFMACQTGGALLWGLIANQLGLRPAVLAAAIAVAVGVVGALFLRVPDTRHHDPQPAGSYWTDPQLAFDPQPDTGPVLVAVHYTIAPEREEGFLEAMTRLRRSRLRTGGTSWELYRDGERPDQFVEIFRVPSWEEHLRQHDNRLTATDRVIEEAALAFSDPPAYGDHLLPP